jgi:hypothetical protein
VRVKIVEYADDDRHGSKRDEYRCDDAFEHLDQYLATNYCGVLETKEPTTQRSRDAVSARADLDAAIQIGDVVGHHF